MRMRSAAQEVRRAQIGNGPTGTDPPHILSPPGNPDDRGRLVKELMVIAKDQPGEMHKIAATLGKAGVNILAVAAYNIEGEGRIHIVVSDNKKGVEALKTMKYKVIEGDVIILELKHSPGELARVTKLLADSGVNIEIIYGSGSTYPSAQLVLGVDDMKKAEKALGLQ